MHYLERVKRLQKLMPTVPCDAFLVEDTTNLYYLTGLQLSAGKVFVHEKGAHLLVDSRYFEMCKEHCPFPVLLLDGEKNSWQELFQQICPQASTLAFDSETTTHRRYTELNAFAKAQQLLLVPADNLIKQLRTIKDPEEITLLRKAAELGSRGFDFVCSLLKEGITEEQLAAALEIFWKQQGSKGLAFDPIIAFGPNAAMPHYRAGKASLKSGDCVLIDIGVNLQHYHSDMTRVVFFGSPHPTIKEIYGIVKKAQEAALSLCRPGTSISDLDRAARSIIEEHGYGKSFTHSLGHGVGLEIHELPILRNAAPYNKIILEAGMVITVEPGIYIPNLGGVRLEDTVAIHDKGYENLTNRTTALFD